MLFLTSLVVEPLVKHKTFISLTLKTLFIYFFFSTCMKVSIIFSYKNNHLHLSPYTCLIFLLFVFILVLKCMQTWGGTRWRERMTSAPGMHHRITFFKIHWAEALLPPRVCIHTASTCWKIFPGSGETTVKCKIWNAC